MNKVRRSNETGFITSGEDISYWIDSVKPIEFETLKQDLDTDVLIVGGGIAGLTTAYQLLKAGRKVTLVEDGLIGSGETGRTTAHLTCALDDRYYLIEKAFGEDGSRKAAESHMAAIDWIESTVRLEGIDCDFERVDGFLFIHPSDTKENLEKEFEASKKAGLQTSWMDHIPGIAGENGPCILFPRQGQFHIMKYLKALSNAIIKMGGRIYTKTHARHINRKGAECNGYKLAAAHIVVATNTPVNDFVAIHAKQAPYRTYVTGLRIPRNAIRHSLWWDTGDQDSKWITAPYHYIRLQQIDDEYDLLIVGGEDHKTGQADAEDVPEQERFTALVEWTKKRFPLAGELIYQWSGQVMEPVDYMAFIGKNPGDDNVYIITGDSGNGMTHGTIGGMIVSDLIQGRENRWADFYSPTRMPLRTPKRFLTEMFNTIKQYGSFINKTDIHELDQLGPGEGAILSKGLRRLAIYKDEQNNVHAFSAVCPHMGCMVQWNAEEKSFDCPCHGSRFTKDGIVINGPATIGLERFEIKD
jgi:glycine/D-amino acid oxidase-like deaminating enzyme/nitrite reductase/ring-hydroxylating ferredoxin subunit